MRFLLLLISVLSVGAEPFKPLCEHPSYPLPPPAKTPPVDEQCGVSGSGAGDAAPEIAQNTAKNDFCAAKDGGKITVQQMIDLQDRAVAAKINFGNPKNTHLKSPGPAKDRTKLRELGEGGLRSLEGYVFFARQEGKESVNCEDKVPDQPNDHDIHISIVADAADLEGNECKTVVAEMSPHHRPDSWTAENVKKLILRKRRVRLTGQLFFDSSHAPCKDGQPSNGDPRRVSLWEIHPIYKLDVCKTDSCSTDAAWIPFDEWAKF